MDIVNKNKNDMKHKKRLIWLMLLAGMMIGCNSQQSEETITIPETTVEELESDVIEQQPSMFDKDTRFYELTSWERDHPDIEVREIEGCTYIFWHKGYGSDFEHHAGCKNPIHWNQNGLQAPQQ